MRWVSATDIKVTFLQIFAPAHLRPFLNGACIVVLWSVTVSTVLVCDDVQRARLSIGPKPHGRIWLPSLLVFYNEAVGTE